MQAGSKLLPCQKDCYSAGDDNAAAATANANAAYDRGDGVEDDEDDDDGCGDCNHDGGEC